MHKKELAFVLLEPKKHSVRYNQAITPDMTPGDGGLASFYIPNWILDGETPKVLKITIEEIK